MMNNIDGLRAKVIDEMIKMNDKCVHVVDVIIDMVEAEVDELDRFFKAVGLEDKSIDETIDIVLRWKGLSK